MHKAITNINWFCDVIKKHVFQSLTKDQLQYDHAAILLLHFSNYRKERSKLSSVIIYVLYAFSLAAFQEHSIILFLLVHESEQFRLYYLFIADWLAPVEFAKPQIEKASQRGDAFADFAYTLRLVRFLSTSAKQSWITQRDGTAVRGKKNPRARDRILHSVALLELRERRIVLNDIIEIHPETGVCVCVCFFFLHVWERFSRFTN